MTSNMKMFITPQHGKTGSLHEANVLFHLLRSDHIILSLIMSISMQN